MMITPLSRIIQVAPLRNDEIPLSKTIKDLVGGKLTLQNKIFNKSLHQHLRKAKNFPLRSWVPHLAVASTEAWASTAQAWFRALSVARSLVVSTRLPTR